MRLQRASVLLAPGPLDCSDGCSEGRAVGGSVGAARVQYSLGRSASLEKPAPPVLLPIEAAETERRRKAKRADQRGITGWLF